MTVVLLGCAVAVGWFARRARVGARARSVAGVRLPLVERAGALAGRAVAGRVAFALLAGTTLGGAGLGLGAAALAAASEPLVRRRATRRDAEGAEAQVPDALRTIAAALRAGRSLSQALEAARDDAVEPLRGRLDRVVRRIELGAPLDDALGSLAPPGQGGSAALAVETLRVGRAAGSDLPRILDVAVATLVERERIALDRRAASAQARMSAAVVAGMPIAFFAVLGSSAREQADVLFGSPIGWALLAAGLGLEACGALWMRALVRSP